MAQSSTLRWILIPAPLLVLACTLSLIRVPMAAPTTPSAPARSWTQAPGTMAAEAATEAPPNGPGHPTPYPTEPMDFCDDPGPLQLLVSLKEAITTADGSLLSSIVSPDHGMDARLLRNGRVVNYDRAHAAALFESTYRLDWGDAPGSGLPLEGSFSDLFVPELTDVLSKPHSTTCNVIRVGGTTYAPMWPYAGIDFYSLYYPGSGGSGGLDWHTWAVGVQRIGDQAYVYAIMQFKWEP